MTDVVKETAQEALASRDLSALSTDRQEEIKRSQAQLGFLENLGLGFTTTALSAGSRKIEQERVGLEDNIVNLTIESILGENGQGLSEFVTSTRALLGETAEGYDPNYNKEEHVESLIAGIPRKYHDDILEETSLEAAQRVRGRILEDLENMQLTSMQNNGFMTRLAGSVVDVDAPLALVSGGSYAAAKTAYTGYRAGRLLGMAERGRNRLAGLTQGISGGAQAGALVGFADSQWRETSDGLDFIYSTLGGATLGASFGTMFGANVTPKLKQDLTDTMDEFVDRVAKADETLTNDTVIESSRIPTEVYGSSVGALQVNQLETFVPRDLNTPGVTISGTNREWIDRAARINYDNDIRMVKDEELNTFMGKWANSDLSVLSGTNLMSRLYKSDSDVSMWFATNILESANGYGRGTATASVLNEKYHRLHQTQFAPYHVASKSWAKRNNTTFLNSGYGITNQGQIAFNRAVMLERNNRNFGRARSTDRDIALAADALDNHMLQAHKSARGEEGQIPVDGFDKIPENPHYYMQNWSPSRIQSIIQAHPDNKKSIINAISASYQRIGIKTKEDADAIANAVITRKQHEFTESDLSVHSLLQKDGQDFLVNALKSNGLSDKEIDGIVKQLTGLNAERGKEGFAKSRNDVDLDEDITLGDGSQIKIVDLMSQNVIDDVQRYSRKVAGAAALARHGISNRTYRREVIDAMNAERRALGEEEIDPNTMLAFFTNFDGGAIKGFNRITTGTELSEAGSAIGLGKNLVSLSWLGQLGLTQAGETATTMAQVGLKNWAARGPVALFHKELKSGNKELLQEAAFFAGNIGQDHHIFMSHRNLDEVSDLDKADFFSKAQMHTSKGLYVAGFTSMFNSVRTFQQQVAFLGMSDKVFRQIKQDLDYSLSGVGKPLSDGQNARLRDLGIDDTLKEYMSNLVDKGVIEFKTVSGITFVDKLNPHLWDDPLMVEQFATVIIRNQNQAVQKSMAGESDPWMHTAVGSIMTHLKTFPMAASQKQFVRHMRNADSEAFGVLGMGLATAMIVSMVKEALDFDGKDMSLEDHAKRAFSYSNMTGFIPMVTDPIADMMGADDLKFNRWSRHTELTPPILSYAEDALRLPGALYHAARGDADYSDRAAVRTLPYSNTILVGEMWQAASTRNN
jgi:hypothetical protein